MSTKEIQIVTNELTVDSGYVNYFADASFMDCVEYFITNGVDIRPTSRAQYKKALKQFNNYCEANNLPFNGLELKDLIGYKEYLQNSGLRNATVISYITALKSFYKWAEISFNTKNLSKGLKTPKKKVEFKKQPLTPNKAKELLQYARTTLSPRDYAIINLILRTGLRTIEVIRANVEDITIKKDKRVLMVHGKGRNEKDEFAILSKEAFEPIVNYLATRKNAKHNDPLFVSESRNNSKGERLTTRSIRRIIKEALKKIDLDDRSFTAHSLRHTFAVTLLDAKVSFEMVQHSLRHANPATTQIYTSTQKDRARLDSDLEKKINKFY